MPLCPGTVHNLDALDFLRGLPDASVDMFVTDPPFYRVKGEAWDRAWDTPAAFLAWLAEVADEMRRAMKPNGSLYLFAWPKMAARVEVMLAQRFEVLNRITWIKDAGWHQKVEEEACRSYFPQTEAILFCEHLGADSMAKGEAGYHGKMDELRGFVFEPLRKYLVDEFAALGWSRERINEICGVRDSASHYVRITQWTLPTEEHYFALQAAANDGHLRREYGHLRREYEDLRREYEDLRREYEDLRRPFTVTDADPYTDVWTFPTVNTYPGKHSCEKPYAMARHIVKASSRPGAVVCDPFCGSGVFLEAAAAMGRQWTGNDASKHWAGVARRRAEKPRLTQSTMFEAA